MKTFLQLPSAAQWRPKNWRWTVKANTDPTQPFNRSTHFLCSLMSRYGPILSPPLSGQRLLYQAWVNILCKCVMAEVTWQHGGHGQWGVDSPELKTHVVLQTCSFFWSELEQLTTTMSETTSLCSFYTTVLSREDVFHRLVVGMFVFSQPVWTFRWDIFTTRWKELLLKESTWCSMENSGCRWRRHLLNTIKTLRDVPVCFWFQLCSSIFWCPHQSLYFQQNWNSD